MSFSSISSYNPNINFYTPTKSTNPVPRSSMVDEVDEDFMDMSMDASEDRDPFSNTSDLSGLSGSESDFDSDSDVDFGVRVLDLEESDDEGDGAFLEIESEAGESQESGIHKRFRTWSDDEEMSGAKVPPSSENENVGQRTRGHENKSQTERPVRRQVLTDLNQAPSIQQSIETKMAGIIDEAEVQFHAEMRMQMFAVKVALYYGVCKGSSLDVRKEVELNLGRAYLQIGKGSHRFHAAHQDTTAGISDDWRAVTMERIATRKDITPRTRQILRCKGFTDEEFERLERNCYEMEKVVQSFDTNWPVNKTRPHSLLSGTRAERVLNATTEVPASVNVFCDKSLEEAIRPAALAILHEVMYARISREEACEKYLQLILDHFSKLELPVKERADTLKAYVEKFGELEDYHMMPTEEMRKTLSELSQIHNGINNVGQDKLRRVILPKNNLFLSESVSAFKKDNASALDFVRNWLVRKKDLLLGEAQRRCEKYAEYVKYVAWEKEGTKLPPFEHIFGSSYKEKEIQRGVGAMSTPQARMLMPMTPDEKDKALRTQSAPSPYVARTRNANPETMMREGKALFVLKV